ncbi:hypothetical protein [Treponema sp.]|uniref:hypothetical protein n=1 Tax=Treponema sp. TaxID=166 RepID=UPI00298E4BA0|nr:hypothetical protein [Treponema sp.]MCQ2240230.1 hypothetical protein [Treponema sp.]
MSTGIFDNTKLSAAIDGVYHSQTYQRTPWLILANQKNQKDNGVFVEIRSKNYENRNFFKAGC